MAIADAAPPLLVDDPYHVSAPHQVLSPTRIKKPIVRRLDCQPENARAPSAGPAQQGIGRLSQPATPRHGTSAPKALRATGSPTWSRRAGSRSSHGLGRVHPLAEQQTRRQLRI